MIPVFENFIYNNTDSLLGAQESTWRTSVKRAQLLVMKSYNIIMVNYKKADLKKKNFELDKK